MRILPYEITTPDEWVKVVYHTIGTSYRMGWQGLLDEFLFTAFKVHRPTRLVLMTMSCYLKASKAGPHSFSLSGVRLELGPPSITVLEPPSEIPLVQEVISF